ncbi:MAG: type II toxin-antitoxin system RelE/ParE family toxin [Oscillospiraceae bacterium]|nr:type II toxin-antitoxin system RelE/ParE family toxin [Oscillospiraceae bacterium]
MRYKIKYMDSSLYDMANIKEYLSQFYASSWVKVMSAIEHRAELLKDMPYSFPLYPGNAIYRKLVVGNYIVLYRIIEKDHIVEIHAIWHGSVNIVEHIENLPNKP